MIIFDGDDNVDGDENVDGDDNGDAKYLMVMIMMGVIYI